MDQGLLLSGKRSQCRWAELETMLPLLPCAAVVEQGGRLVVWNGLARQMHRDDLQTPAVDLLEEQVFLGAFPYGRTAPDDIAMSGFECGLLAADGTVLAIHGAASALDTDLGPARLVMFHEDKALRRLGQEGRSLISDLLNAAPEAMALTRDGRVLYVNREFTRMFGFPAAECFGRVLDELIVPGEKQEAADEMHRQVERQGKVILEAERCRKDGTAIDVSLLIGKVDFEKDHALFHGFRDVRRQKLNEKLLHYRAMHDSLTGLVNRALFVERVQLALRRLKREPMRASALLFLDLDGFKAVNDSLGHDAGDTLLMSVAKTLRECVRPQDSVARFGGDEFALLLEEAGSVAGAQAVAERVLQSVAEVSVRGMKVSASLGIVMLESSAQTAVRAMKDADTAMYRAKAAGKACAVVFEPGMTMQRRGVRTP